MVRAVPLWRSVVLAQVVPDVLDAAEQREQFAAGAAVLGLDLARETLRVSRAPVVQAAVGQLSKRDREICEALSLGYSIQGVADQLGCDWHTVNRRIAHIREQFTAWVLDGWLEGA